MSLSDHARFRDDLSSAGWYLLRNSLLTTTYDSDNNNDSKRLSTFSKMTSMQPFSRSSVSMFSSSTCCIILCSFSRVILFRMLRNLRYNSYKPVSEIMSSKKGKSSPYSIAEHRVPELILVLGSQPAGDVSHKPGGRLPLLSARPAVTITTRKKAATNFTAW